MPPNPMYHRIIEQSRPASRRGSRPRDSLATLLLGTLAAGLGCATLDATLAGIGGKPLSPWNRPIPVLTESSPRQYEYTRDPDSGMMSRQVKLVVATTILVPSPYCVGFSLAGMILGGTGLALGMRRRRVSWASAAGLLLSVLGPCIGMAYEIALNLLY